MFHFYSTFLKYCSSKKGKETVTVMWYSLSKKRRMFAEKCALYTKEFSIATHDEVIVCPQISFYFTYFTLIILTWQNCKNNMEKLNMKHKEKKFH